MGVYVKLPLISFLDLDLDPDEVQLQIFNQTLVHPDEPPPQMFNRTILAGVGLSKEVTSSLV